MEGCESKEGREEGGREERGTYVSKGLMVYDSLPTK